MIKKKPRSVNQLLTSKSLKDLIAHAYSLSQLHKIFIQYIDPSIQKHYQISNYSNGKLTIECENANWATRLSFIRADLLIQLRQHDEFSQLQSISELVKKHAYHQPTPRPQRSPNRMSDNNASDIKDFSDSVEDETLKGALDRLARWFRL